MNIEDIIISPKKIETQPWQLGSVITNEIPENGILLVFCSDYRGGKGNAVAKNFDTVREEFYKLSKFDFEIPICDLGDLISGKTLEDTHYILQEILSACLYKNTVPIVVGGGNDLSIAMIHALNFHQKNIRYTQINNKIDLSNEGDEISEQNFLQKIFNSKLLSLKDYHHLGYQKHLNEIDAVKLMKSVEFDVVRLAEMMGNTDRIEPFFRRADLVTLNSDAVESFAEPFSVNPQINGLNRREICAVMKEIGLGENLKMAGIFNFNADAENILNHQLLAQMLWYLLEGIDIQKTHPKERHYDTFWVLIDDQEFAFKRDSFTGLWYFGSDENIQKCVPCSQYEYDLAKNGVLSERLLRIF